MEPRVSIITLGVEDLDRAAQFYETMGLKRDQRFVDNVAFFQMGGLILALWPREALIEDSGQAALGPRGSPGLALAYNTRTPAEVEVVLKVAEAAGGRILKPAQKAFWGGVQGYFEDTEGHLWEVAWNPDFPIDEEGRISLPA